ncbi:MAG: PA2778 family cysteine peptidase [Proteobacteria bacterium]|nr:PA2778 family cysteine peptidase [Pseudomonadota bacterium]
MLTRRLRHCTVVAGLVCLSACATDVRLTTTAVELKDTPFYAQVTDQCGPSALATILQVSGVAVTPEVLKSRVYIPGREGSLQIELLAATRGYRRIPYRVDPLTTALVAELRSGRPVLVLQNLGRKSSPIWHYAVVVGYLPKENQFVLRSGDQARHLMRVSRFTRTWARAGFWGVVALQPGELPALPVAKKYIRSVAGLEAIGDAESAIAGYDAATHRWPQESLAWFGLGNAYYAQENLDAAEDAYKTALTIKPDYSAALNNLSQVQADRGCYAQASATLDIALASVEPNSPMHEILESSLSGLAKQERKSICIASY